tara:strand:- start:2418 stop:2645 length:228 start_codon:yes stop_codon:yes gene_type:complete
MIKIMRKYKHIQYKNLTENKKDEILQYITETGIPISKVAIKFNVTVSTMNKIFDERYNKRENIIEEMKKNINLDE